MRTAANVDSQTSQAISAGVNPLAGISNQHEIAGILGSQDGKETDFLGLEILHFVDDYGVKWALDSASLDGVGRLAANLRPGSKPFVG
jgi:hypothetical protein